VIEDDDVIVDTIRITFQVGWQTVQIISTKFGEEGIRLVESQSPDIVILDLGLPDINGFEVIKAIRLFSLVPVIVLTVQTEEKSVVKAIELGANDYINKPFRQLELLARVKGAIRNRHPDSMAFSSIGPFNFDISGRRLTYNNKKIYLTSTEVTILRYLLLNKGQIVTYEQIAQQIWDSSYPGFKKTLRVYISHLREKLKNDAGKKIIVSHPGIGYSINI
jgi:two-component system KDP operon response regulator KdpE